MATITVHTAKTTLSKLIERALSGEEIIIARGKVPAVRLVPVASTVPKRKFGALKGRGKITKAFFEPLPPEELAGWNS